MTDAEQVTFSGGKDQPTLGYLTFDPQTWRHRLTVRVPDGAVFLDLNETDLRRLHAITAREVASYDKTNS